MVGRGKRKANSQSKGNNNKNDNARAKTQPKIVESVNDSDDEEIDEDEAFNSEDERMYGHFFEKTKKSQPSHQQKGGSDESGDDDPNSSDEEVEEDDSDDDEDDDDDEEDDGGQYMLDLLEKLESVGNKKNAKDQINSAAQMAKLSESEYSSSISKKGLTLDNLMEGLEDTQGFKTLQKTFANQQTATPAPLVKVVADRKQRQIVYENERKDITRWTKVVQENRQAETLDFKPKERLNITRETLVDKFEPTTEFEKELEQALEEAGQQDEEAVLKAEEQALQDDLGANRLTMEEYKKRRGQLAQVRALMFYHEQKRHHINKIKSKKYRRIRKKQRERLKDSALEAAIEDDEELAREMKEKEEVARIQERMTLAHKNTSKWAKRVLKRGKNVDLETRRALSAQLKRGDDLRRKLMGEEEDDQSDNDSDEDLVDSARKVLEDIEATDPTQGKTGLFKLSFMQKGLMKQRDKARDETRRLLNELQANEKDDYDDVDDGSAIDHDDDPKTENTEKKAIIASDKEMSHIMKSGELVATTLAFGNSNTISTSGGIEIDLGGTTNGDEPKDSGTGPTGEDTLTEHVATFDSQGTSNKKVKSGSAQKEQGTPKSAKKDTRVTEVSTTPAISNTGSRNAISEEVNPWLQATESEPQSLKAEPKAKTNAKLGKKVNPKKGIVDIEGAASILDSGGTKDSNVPANSKPSNSSDSVVVVEEKKISMLSQEELIRRAFASSEKEVEEEFRKEKEAMASENDPTRQVSNDKGSKEVAGWGSWVGVGAPPPASNRKKKPLPKKLQAPVKKPDPTRKRKDEGKPNVIINQKRQKKLASTYMLGDVPHPYSSRVEYEQAMLGGLGREWNVSSSFKNMTRPEILTRAGKIIQPISKKAKVARAPAKF